MKSNSLRALVAVVVVAALAFAVGCYAANGKDAKKPEKPVAKQLPKLIDLGATKCIPCKMMAPILEELAKEYKGQLEVEFIDVWKDKKASQKYKIQSIPTQIFYDAKGKEFFRHAGFYPKEDILKAFEKQGIKLKKPSNTPKQGRGK